MTRRPATPATVVEVVGAAIVRRGRCLAARRSATMPLPGKWELPGGKVEPGEDPRAALVREIHEELGVTVRAGEAIGVGETRAADGAGRVRLTVYLATLEAGEIELREHEAWGWFGAAELRALDWAEADRPAVARLVRLLGGTPEP